MNYGQANHIMQEQQIKQRQEEAYNTGRMDIDQRLGLSHAQGAIAGAEQCEQSHIHRNMQHLENQLEQCLSHMAMLMHRLRVVSRDPNIVREEKQSTPKLEGNSEFAQRVHSVINGLMELDRRIAMQLNMLEI